MASTGDEMREQVRARYAESARAVIGVSWGSGRCYGGESKRDKFGQALYGAEQRRDVPEAAALASLGCGNPTAVTELNDGETVLHPLKAFPQSDGVSALSSSSIRANATFAGVVLYIPSGA
jgi:hypothetical protein